MADPFEVRLRFTNLLSHLSASSSASIRCAQYALKHRDMDEDLHSCILEQLERNNMNNRANIMYFLEHFCELSIKEGYHEYVGMIRRDIARIVEAVVVGSGEGAGGGVANIKVVRRVLGGLGEKGVLRGGVMEEMEELLREREGAQGGLLAEEDELGHSGGRDREGEGGKMLVEIGEGANVVDVPKEDLTVREQRMDVDSRPTPKLGGGGAVAAGGGGAGGAVGVKQVNGVMRVDKRVIEQRIEEDRERNKRLRESVWAVGKDDQDELDKMWDEGSDMGDDDSLMALEEADERRQGAIFSHDIAA